MAFAALRQLMMAHNADLWRHAENAQTKGWHARQAAGKSSANSARNALS
jgi:hypothetical protein